MNHKEGICFARYCRSTLHASPILVVDDEETEQSIRNFKTGSEEKEAMMHQFQHWITLLRYENKIKCDKVQWQVTLFFFFWQ